MFRGDLLDPRDLHDRIVAELFHQFLDYLLVCKHHAVSPSLNSNYFNKFTVGFEETNFLAIFKPETNASALPVAGLKIATFDTSIGILC